jgi:hypothetical protein
MTRNRKVVGSNPTSGSHNPSSAALSGPHRGSALPSGHSLVHSFGQEVRQKGSEHDPTAKGPRRPPGPGLRRPRPLTGRKRWVSRQIPGSGRAAMKQAKQIEAQLMAEVGAGRHQRSAMTLAQLLDEWLAWREQRQAHFAGTLHGYRLVVETKIKPALGYLPVAKVDARVLDRFYAALRGAGNARTGGGAPSASRIRDVHAILSGALGGWAPAGAMCRSMRRCWLGRRRRATPLAGCPRPSWPQKRTRRAPGRPGRPDSGAAARPPGAPRRECARCRRVAGRGLIAVHPRP